MAHLDAYLNLWQPGRLCFDLALGSVGKMTGGTEGWESQLEQLE